VFGVLKMVTTDTFWNNLSEEEVLTLVVWLQAQEHLFIARFICAKIKPTHEHII